MHWQAIRRSTGTRKCGDVHKSLTAVDGAGSAYTFDVSSDRFDEPTVIPLGHDNASDIRAGYMLPPEILSSETLAKDDNPVDVPGNDEEDEHFQVAIPTFTTGLTPFGYQRALQNRIMNDKLRRHGEFDMRAYRPMFVHDCLMLPGSLANILGKGSPEQLIPRMTPALLPGFHAYVHSETQQPCILQSPDHSDYVQGMLIVGQGKAARKSINEHFRKQCRRIKVDVEVDVVVSVPLEERSFFDENFRLRRRTVEAYAWIWSNVSSGDVHFRAQASRWTLEDYIGGALAPQQHLRIEETGWLEEDVTVSERREGNQEPPREVVYGGCGALDYERAETFTGW